MKRGVSGARSARSGFISAARRRWCELGEELVRSGTVSTPDEAAGLGRARLLDEIAGDSLASPFLLADVYEDLADSTLVPAGRGSGDVLRCLDGGADAVRQLAISERRGRRRTRGAFYTPQAVVRDIVRTTLDGWSPSPARNHDGSPCGVAVLDPATGCGRFLLAAREGLRLSARRPPPPLLVGIDTDPGALLVARELLAVGDVPGAARVTLLRADALPLLAPGASLFTPKTAPLPAGFSLIVGNPPYGRVRDAARRDALRGRFPLHRGGFDRYRLFLEACLAHLAPGGRLGLLLPTTWLTLRHAAPLRQHLLERMRLVSLSRYDGGLFPGAFIDVAAVVIENSLPGGRAVTLRTVPSLSALTARDAIATTTAAARDVLSARLAVVPGGRALSAEPWERRLAERLTRAHPPAGTLARFVCGLKPYQRGKGRPPQTGAEAKERRFEVDSPIDDSCRPLVAGSQIHPFHLDRAPRSWLRYGPWLAEPRDPAVFDRPLKLLGRQTGNRIVVAPDTEGRVARDSTYVALPPRARTDADARPTLLWLLGVLNDPIATWLFWQSDPDEVRKTFPQVRISSIRRLPVPRLTALSRAAQSEALAAIDTCRKIARHEPEALPSASLLSLVARAYGLTDDEARRVRERVARRPS